MNVPRNESSSPAYAGNDSITRRSFTTRLLAATAALATMPVFGNAHHASIYDYIVVGAGAGGGPVAANLAKAGYKVALVEAGVDPLGAEAEAVDPNAGILYRVPLFAPAAAENPFLSWNFFVKHYADPVQQSKDSKFVLDKGVLYPRGSCLGGSTAHNVMNWVYPHDDDWNGIAEITGDHSWRAGNMRDFFVRLENCEYCRPLDPGHGFNGYMPAAILDRNIFNFDSRLQDLASAKHTLPASFFHGNTALDINHPLVAKGDTGSFVMAMHVSRKMRVSIREHLVDTQQSHPDKLFLITGALASKVLFDGRQAIGVEFLQGANLYEADKLFDALAAPSTHRIFARKEVILSAGAFNTPQLLKLSGIGPAAELRRHGIGVLADVPGVGANMQDRYEIAVSAALKQSLQPFATCKPNQASDACFSAWFNGRFPRVEGEFFGPYANNGVLTVRLLKSDSSRELPDLCIFGGMTGFNGYAPGFSQNGFADQRWSWLILKAHTNNNAGVVKLKSTSPRQTPEINFHYFNEGTDAAGEDLRSVVRGVEFARSLLNDPAAARHIDHEIVPGSQVQTAAEIEAYVRNEAWGHHASCTAKIGADDDRMAVLDSRFRVRGVKALRVVDACVFPRIPGFFPVAAILMVGEKASDVLLEDAVSGAR